MGGGAVAIGGNIKAADFNIKTILNDTGANIAAFASPTAGMVAYCTTSGSGFISGHYYYYNGTNWRPLEELFTPGLGLTDPMLRVAYEFESNLNDSSFKGNTLTKTAGTTTYSSTKQVGTKSLSFDGSTYFQPTTPDLPFSFDYTQPFFVSFWMNCAAQNNIALICKDSGGFATKGWQIYLTQSGGGNDGYINFALVNTASTNLIQMRFLFSNLMNSTFHHILVSYDGSTQAAGVQCWIDGVAQSPLNITDTLTATTKASVNLSIGAVTGGLSKYTGLFDAIYIGARALSGKEAFILYMLGKLGLAIQ